MEPFTEWSVASNLASASPIPLESALSIGRPGTQFLVGLQYYSMSDNLELTILKKQNTQLAARIDIYRKQNKELQQKNEDFSTWTVNLASVLSSIEAAFRVFLENEESLYELIKPKGNKESTAIVAKCVNHFKHFNQILSNLPKKICSDDRSNQFTAEAKQGIQSLVSSYEIFFKEFLKSYFAFNQKQEEWLQSVLKSSDMRDQYRDLFKREKENTEVIKSFNLHFQQLRGKFPAYETQNQRVLLSDLLKKKTEEVEELTEKNSRLTHRFRLLMDYNPNVVSQAISQSQNYTCICGGVQMAYLKDKWQKAQQARNQEKQVRSQKGIDNEEKKVLQNQIEVLVKQNSGYLTRNQQLKIENNIEESIFKSHAYHTLVKQAQQLVRYCGSLQRRIRELQQVIMELQKSREKELKELRAKYQSEKSNIFAPLEAYSGKNRINSKELCDMITNTFKPIIAKIEQNKEWDEKYLEMEKGIRQNLNKMKEENQTIHRKYDELLMKRGEKAEVQIKQSYKSVVKQVEGYLPKDGLLQKFNEYVRNREKKVEYCERQIKKLDKELSAKSALCDTMKGNFQLNENQFVLMTKKNEELNKSVKTMEEYIKKIVEQNTQIKNQNQKEKSLLELKLKSEIEVNSKSQEKIKVLEEKMSKLNQIPTVYQDYIKSQELALKEMKQKLDTAEQECAKTNELLNRKLAKLREYQKSEKQYTEDNQRLRSKLNAIKKTQAKNMQQNNDEENLNLALMELEDLKRKFICSCQKQRPIEVTLKTCPHVFCRACVEDVLKSRSRACPLCRVKFSRADVNEMKWT